MGGIRMEKSELEGVSEEGGVGRRAGGGGGEGGEDGGAGGGERGGDVVGA